jgi:hypothetical protein
MTKNIDTKMAMDKNMDFGYFIGAPPLSGFLNARFAAVC